MKKLILFAGLPGVGKSTFSQKVSTLLSAEVIDVDDFKKISVDQDSCKSQIDPPEIRWKYYKAALQYALELFENGTSTITIDEVFHSHELRTKVEGYCTENNIEVFWVEVQCAYEKVKERKT